MADERREFSEYYPGGGAGAHVPAASDVAGRVGTLEAKLAAAAAIPAMDPDGGESLAEVKEWLGAVKAALE